MKGLVNSVLVPGKKSIGHLAEEALSFAGFGEFLAASGGLALCAAPPSNFDDRKLSGSGRGL
jgi:hypothetical protein